MWAAVAVAVVGAGAGAVAPGQVGRHFVCRLLAPVLCARKATRVSTAPAARTLRDGRTAGQQDSRTAGRRVRRPGGRWAVGGVSTADVPATPALGLGHKLIYCVGRR